MTDSTWPASTHAERMVIGALVKGEVAPAFWDDLQADLFTGPCLEIFQAMEKLRSAGNVADVFQVADQFSPDSEAMLILDTVTREVTTGHPAGEYVRQLRLARARRNAEQIAVRLIEKGDINRSLMELNDLDTGEGSETLDGGEVKKSFWADMQRRSAGDVLGLKTGIHSLDELLGGIEPQDFVIIAGRPSMGKTALMLNVVAHQTVPAGIFSLETSAVKLLRRMVAAKGFDIRRLKRPDQLTDADWPRLVDLIKRVKQDVFINETGGISISALESSASRMVKQHGCRLICIDYLQLVTCPAERRLEEVSEISRRLRKLAKTLNVPVIALSQLNRSSEHNVNPKPKMSDLRESGQIEQDAEMIVLVHREEHYNGARPGEADLIVAKNKDGETGTVAVSWQGKFQRFGDLTREWSVT